MKKTTEHKEPDISFEQLEEIVNLLAALYGQDFTEYSKASLKRRVNRILMKKHFTVYELKQEIINQPSFVDELILEITVNVTEMFRDPAFYGAVRKKVLPYLKSFPRIKIWNAGCSTGEEVYSFAIMLDESGMYANSFLYGTDINTRVLDKARKGIYTLHQMKEYSENYLKTGGTASLAEFYSAAYDAAAIHQGLKKNVLFATHNLATDSVFNEFEMIVCRNVLIYFENSLQEKVIQLFYDSLRPLGFLCLGSKETIRFTELRKKFRVVDQEQKIYQKIG
ncbi:MAG: protein-glutamate O-methyltransferase CheR [Bacteroidota bacterium]